MRERAAQLLDAVGLGNKLSRPSRHLSGGEQQRVAVARALANDPRVILADEPTGNLDTQNLDRAFELLQDVVVRGGKALLLVTHNPKIARPAIGFTKCRTGESSRPTRAAALPSFRERDLDRNRIAADEFARWSGSHRRGTQARDVLQHDRARRLELPRHFHLSYRAASRRCRARHLPSSPGRCSAAGVKIVYGGDGDRVQESVAGVEWQKVCLSECNCFHTRVRAFHYFFNRIAVISR